MTCHCVAAKYTHFRKQCLYRCLKSLWPDMIGDCKKLKSPTLPTACQHWRCIRMQQHLHLQAVDFGNALFEDTSKIALYWIMGSMWQHIKGILQSFRVFASIPGNELAADLRRDIASVTASTAESIIRPNSTDETSNATAPYLKRQLTETLEPTLSFAA